MKDDSAIVARLLETQRGLLIDLDTAYSRERALLRKLGKSSQGHQAKTTPKPTPPRSTRRNRARKTARAALKNPAWFANKVCSKMRTSVGSK